MFALVARRTSLWPEEAPILDEDTFVGGTGRARCDGAPAASPVFAIKDRASSSTPHRRHRALDAPTLWTSWKSGVEPIWRWEGG